MTLRGVPISWARPAARLPIAASFSERIIWRSNHSRSRAPCCTSSRSLATSLRSSTSTCQAHTSPRSSVMPLAVSATGTCRPSWASSSSSRRSGAVQKGDTFSSPTASVEALRPSASPVGRPRIFSIGLDQLTMRPWASTTKTPCPARATEEERRSSRAAGAIAWPRPVTSTKLSSTWLTAPDASRTGIARTR